MSERVERMAEIYNKIAEDYAQKKEREYSSTEIDAFTSLLAPVSRIVSAGCGHGRDMAHFREIGYDVAGVDISEALLKNGRQRHPNLAFALADMRNMPFADESFHGVWAHESIHHLEKQDIVPALQEFHRVLVPGGVLFILTRQGRGDVEVKEPMSSGQAREYTLLEPDELHGMLAQIGFEQIELYTFNEQQRKANGRDLNWVSAFYRKARFIHS